MQFKTEVQKQFEKAGWFEGRNMKSAFEKLDGFEKFPDFLKEFLYEYGDLIVKTIPTFEGAVMNFKALTEGGYSINEYLSKPAYYGGKYTFPIAYYPLDNTTLECDAEGRIYMAGDFPCLVSNDFIAGIEKVIMEDYSDTLVWNPETNQWADEYQ
ncbi:hypothetical protein GCM10007424_20470 [Flavobacterium suaedae]|uniref:SUKH-3 domain containing protein n=1 Tax=Flavobacterium suaedae TaxID=1767027 RepID=A0ABQ1K0X3_9FLAO|nr:SUKH-3 domain-containing protein [Flavobacterium suaedae]GGB80263.1 hypothetical protein GCM10007424_20470 [Flavobacterium suaedae]